MSVVEDEVQLRRLIMRYGQRIDRRECDGFLTLFTPDAALEGETFCYGTPAAIRAVPESMKVYTKTYHVVWNHLFEITGDTATGEVYSAAHHLTEQPDGSYSDFIMVITYRDRYVRRGSEWLFARRHLTPEFTETRAVDRLRMTPQLDRMRNLGE